MHVQYSLILSYATYDAKLKEVKSQLMLNFKFLHEKPPVTFFLTKPTTTLQLLFRNILCS